MFVAKQRAKQRQWDIHFLKRARLAAEPSKCLSRKIGAVAVRGNMK